MPPDPSELTALAGFAERLAKLDQQRHGLFAGTADMFGDPAWRILLDLFVARVAGKRVPVSSACIASHAPTTTALRWIIRLERRALIVRSPDATDARRTFVAISDCAFDLVIKWLRAAYRQLGKP